MSQSPKKRKSNSPSDGPPQQKMLWGSDRGSAEPAADGPHSTPKAGSRSASKKPVARKTKARKTKAKPAAVESGDNQAPPTSTASTPVAQSERQVLSISQITGQIRRTLEGNFGSVWVRGEISDLTRPSSGHLYLTLKDKNSQIRGVVWRSAAQRLDVELSDGMEVIAWGRVEVYPPRGTYQLVLERVEAIGQGALQAELRKRQQKLAAEGLFAKERKRPLPRFPKCIGIVTSPTGAALRDFLEVLRRRWRGANVLIIPARVQGSGAAREIARGIHLANFLQPGPDVLVVGRGGGSLEDLWCFNEEVVVRALAESRIPTISAVGHEIDVTLADLVADRRALTPSEAAEISVPAETDLLLVLRQQRERLKRAIDRRLEQWKADLRHRRQQLEAQHPRRRLQDSSRRVDELEVRLDQAIQRQLTMAQRNIAAIAGKLQSLSPLAVLQRGYSLTYDLTGQVLLSDESVQVGDQIVSRLANGRLISRVEEKATAGDNSAESSSAENNSAENNSARDNWPQNHQQEP